MQPTQISTKPVLLQTCLLFHSTANAYPMKHVHFWIWVQVQNSTIFEKIGYKVKQGATIKKNIKNIFIYIYLYIFTIKIFLENTLYVLGSQNKEGRRQETQNKKENTKEVTNIQNKIEE